MHLLQNGFPKKQVETLAALARKAQGWRNKLLLALLAAASKVDV